MDLRAEFLDILDKHGHFVYLAIREKARCTCYRYPHMEADPSCARCLGTGHPVKIHLSRVCSFPTASGFVQATSLVTYDPGQHVMGSTTYYLDIAPTIRSGDLLVEPIRSKGQFLGIQSLFKIADPQTFYMENRGTPSQPIYVRAGAITIPARKTDVERGIKKHFRGEI